MIENGRISNFQSAMLTITSLTIMGHLILLTLVIHNSRQDGWIASIAGVSLSIIGIYAQTKLAQWFPRVSLIEILFQRFSWPGKFVGTVYLLYFYILTVLAVRLFAEAYKIIMRETPEAAFVAVIILISAYIVYLGLETAARMNQILLPVLVLIAIGVAILTSGQKEYARLLPMLASGITPVTRGAFAVMGWFGEFVIMGMVLPYVQRPEKLLRANLIAAALTLLFFLGPVTGPIAAFGTTEAADMVLPTFAEIRYIHLGKYVDRFDLIAVLFWTVGLLFRIAIFFYGMCLGTAQAFGFRTYRPLIIPMAWLIGVGAMWFSANYFELNEFLFHAYVPMNIVMGFIVPCLIMVGAFWLRRNTPPA